MLINREKYVEEATLFRDTDLVKVVTGVRRCGKSSLLALVRKKSKPKRLKTGGSSQSTSSSADWASKPTTTSTNT